jgi:hypothetical protein
MIKHANHGQLQHITFHSRSKFRFLWRVQEVQTDLHHYESGHKPDDSIRGRRLDGLRDELADRDRNHHPRHGDQRQINDPQREVRPQHKHREHRKHRLDHPAHCGNKDRPPSTLCRLEDGRRDRSAFRDVVERNGRGDKNLGASKGWRTAGVGRRQQNCSFRQRYTAKRLLVGTGTRGHARTHAYLAIDRTLETRDPDSETLLGEQIRHSS